MGKNIFRKAVFVLLILLLGIMCVGCEEGKGIAANSSMVGSLNESELLKTEEVVKLLNLNGVNLSKADDFPIDLSLCKVYGMEPKPYLSSDTGNYYMFYEYDGYGETSELVRHSMFFDCQDCAKEYSDYIFYHSVSGKNLYLCVWCPEMGPWVDGRHIEREVYEPFVQEYSLIAEILYEKTFDPKAAMLTGYGDSWEVVMPVEYIYNLRQAKEDAGKIVQSTKGQTYLKYLGPERETPNVTSISWIKSKNSHASMSTDEGSLLEQETFNGFYRISSNNPGYNPIQNNGVTVTITWGEGETEEIVCRVYPLMAD